MSERDAVAALAVQLDELRQQLDEARRDVAAAKAIVSQWNARLETEGVGATLMMRRDFKKLGEKVDGLATALADALDRGKLKTPGAPRWDDLDQEQEAAQLAALREWVNATRPTGWAAPCGRRTSRQRPCQPTRHATRQR